jgi:hypothetical protein
MDDSKNIARLKGDLITAESISDFITALKHLDTDKSVRLMRDVLNSKAAELLQAQNHVNKEPKVNVLEKHIEALEMEIRGYKKSVQELTVQLELYKKREEKMEAMDGATAESAEAPSCIMCGCLGNNSCGCEPIKSTIVNGCGLDQCLVCPCCAALGKEENIKRWYHPKTID